MPFSNGPFLVPRVSSFYIRMKSRFKNRVTTVHLLQCKINSFLCLSFRGRNLSKLKNIHLGKPPLISKKKKKRFVYTHLHSSTLIQTRLVTRLHSSTFVQTRLVTRLHSSTFVQTRLHLSSDLSTLVYIRLHSFRLVSTCLVICLFLEQIPSIHPEVFFKKVA